MIYDAKASLFQTVTFGEQANYCKSAIAVAENRHGIPHKLLLAIATVESGRWNAELKKSEPWPWTVQSAGKSYYFDSKKEAITFVEKLQRKGVKNIDVGCMQVNLHYHKTAFQSLEEAFDADANVNYGAGFLKKLKQGANNWKKAVAHYHSRTKSLYKPYQKLVYSALSRALGKGAKPVWNDASWAHSSQHSQERIVPHTFYRKRPLIDRHYNPKTRGRYGVTGARISVDRYRELQNKMKTDQRAQGASVQRVNAGQKTFHELLKPKVFRVDHSSTPKRPLRESPKSQILSTQGRKAPLNIYRVNRHQRRF